MADWSTRESALIGIKACYVAADQYKNDCLIDLNNAWDYIKLMPVGNTYNALKYIYYGCYDICRALNQIVYDDGGTVPEFVVPLFLDDFTSEGNGAGAEVTWKSIIQAWNNASDPGKMWMITEWDWMHKQLWNKPTEIKWQENPFE